jgi:RNA polymerase sigma factor (sigma-70 family)
MCLCEQHLLKLLAENLYRNFDLLVGQYQQKLFVFILLKVHHRQDAEDIVQETFIRAYRCLASLSRHEDMPVKLSPWLFKIAHNCSSNHMMRGGKRSSQLVSMDCSDMRELLESTRYGQYASPEQVVEERETLYQVYICIQQLRDHHRLPVILRHIVGLGYQEVADILDQPLNTTKSNAHRGLKALRNLLQDQMSEEVS